MKVVLFGATGMVGQGVLRECLGDAGVERVVTIGRRATGQKHPKLREIERTDLTAYDDLAPDLAGTDACFFCLGVSSAGMSETEYRRVTYDIAVAAARAIVEKNPGSTFVYVSGTGTDAESRTMWARVKGAAENAIFAMPFKAAFAFRPAFIRPMHGIKSRTAAYRIFYAVLWPFFPLIRALFPRQITTTELVGVAMLNVARRGFGKRVLENDDINAAARLVSDPASV
jgi:uncharacterized protein YbjT (DUF2867 family)